MEWSCIGGHFSSHDMHVITINRDVRLNISSRMSTEMNNTFENIIYFLRMNQLLFVLLTKEDAMCRDCKCRGMCANIEGQSQGWRRVAPRSMSLAWGSGSLELLDSIDTANGWDCACHKILDLAGNQPPTALHHYPLGIISPRTRSRFPPTPNLVLSLMAAVARACTSATRIYQICLSPPPRHTHTHTHKQAHH